VEWSSRAAAEPKHISSLLQSIRHGLVCFGMILVFVILMHSDINLNFIVLIGHIVHTVFLPFLNTS